MREVRNRGISQEVFEGLLDLCSTPYSAVLSGSCPNKYQQIVPGEEMIGVAYSVDAVLFDLRREHLKKINEGRINLSDRKFEVSNPKLFVNKDSMYVNETFPGAYENLVYGLESIFVQFGITAHMNEFNTSHVDHIRSGCFSLQPPLANQIELEIGRIKTEQGLLTLSNRDIHMTLYSHNSELKDYLVDNSIKHKNSF